MTSTYRISAIRVETTADDPHEHITRVRIGFDAGAGVSRETVVSNLRKASGDRYDMFVNGALTDVVVASKFGADAEHVVVPADAIESSPFGADGLGLDIGPDTAAHFAELREKGKAQADALAKAREKTLEKKRANLRVARAVQANAAARKKAKNQRPAPGEAR